MSSNTSDLGWFSHCYGLVVQGQLFICILIYHKLCYKYETVCVICKGETLGGEANPSPYLKHAA